MYALITGASRGIGKAIAKYFANNHINLILICKENIDSLYELSNELSANGIICHCFKCHIGNYDEVNKLWDNIKELNITIDILINNASVSYVGLLQDMNISEWNSIMNTNLNSLFYMCKNAIKQMLQNHSGKIINISSVWGDVGASMEVAYSASKGAVNSFTKALAKELAPSNIQVNAIAFGAIDTDMNKHLSAEERQMLEESIPISRYGTVEECAKLIYNIATAPEYLTGSIITMDGAWI